MDYSKMTQEDFDNCLRKLLENDHASELLNIPGIYEIVSEHYNNEVLDAWAKEQETTT